MKKLLFIFAAAMFSATAHADCAQEAETATGFMNAYIAYLNDSFSKKTAMPAGQWIQQNGLLTDRFKNDYKQLVDDADKEDPEMGLDFDPILDAQDWPDKGFTAAACDQAGFVTLQGKGWEQFQVVVKAVKTPAGWRVDGAGVINVPQDRQAKR